MNTQYSDRAREQIKFGSFSFLLKILQIYSQAATYILQRMLGKKPKTLAEMANVGPATLGDFKVLGIQDPKQLAKREAFELWEDLCKRTRKRHDPCCIDVFMSAIAQARGEAPCPWWHFTKERKSIMAKRTRKSISRY